MGKEQYLTEAHYLTCTNGMYPLRMKIDGKRTTKFSGSLAANANDLQRGSNFTCVGKVAFAAGFVAGFALGVAALIPGPGWVVAAIIAAAILAAMVIARLKGKAAAVMRHSRCPRKWSVRMRADVSRRHQLYGLHGESRL